MVAITELITLDSRVQGPPGLVYSTEPRRAEGDNGISYFIKGPDKEVVFAEIAGCLLAREVDLPVPDVATCHFSAEVYAGSQKVEDALREIDPWLSRPQKVSNFDALFEMIVVDAWLANKDRNIGNVLAMPIGGSRVQFVMIDFEKSRTLRPTPTISSAMLSPRELWPSGDLGRFVSQRKPLRPPTSIIDRVRSLTEARCTQILTEVAAAIGGSVPWVEDSLHALLTRATRLQQIVEGLWSTN